MYFREEQERDYYILGKQKAEKAQIFLKLLLKKYVLCDLGFLWFVVFLGGFICFFVFDTLLVE